MEQRFTGGREHPVLLEKPVEEHLHAGIARGEPSEGFVLTRVVKTVGYVLEVMDNLSHEGVVGGAPGLESLELSVKKPEQSREMDVLGVPRRDGI